MNRDPRDDGTIDTSGSMITAAPKLDTLPAIAMSTAFDQKAAPPDPTPPDPTPTRSTGKKRRRSERKAARTAVVAMKQAAPSRSYTATREELESGDLLLFRGKGFISMMIRALTNSPYSHAGLVYRFEGRVYCLEAVGHGVRLILMSELKKRYDGGIDYYVVDGADKPVRERAIGFCFQQLGKLYSKRGIVRFLIALLFDKKSSSDEDDEWFCSELVAAAYEKQHMALCSSEAFYTSPNDLALSPRVKLRFTIKEE